MSHSLTRAFATFGATEAPFSDEALLRAMLDAETALARAEADCGLIPQRAAESIGRAAADVAAFDPTELARQSLASATVTQPLVQALTARVAALDPDSARFVHWGATSQDIWDTALVLCLARAWPAIAEQYAKTRDRLLSLSDAHANTVMLGRTLLQPATPTTFGLKTALWLDGIARTWASADRAVASARVVQLGGAAGTLAPFADRGAAVTAAFASALSLAVPDAPWHTNRDRIASVGAALGIHVGALGKMARDVALLMQPEVGEVSESGGGSSTMPHKRNPSASAIVIAAATRMPGLVASCLAAMSNEHERGVGGWHAEAPLLDDAVETTGAALHASASLLGGLTVDADRMRMNLTTTRGVIFAERVTLAATATLGRDVASQLVTRAIGETTTSGRAFADVVRATPQLVEAVPAGDLVTLDDPLAYLGSAERYRQAVVARVRSVS